jgi:hypothetical protein
MNIFEVVETNGAIIHANDELGFFITWNGSATLQWWNAKDINRLTFEAVDIRTDYNLKSLADAEREANEWVKFELSCADEEMFSNIGR